MKIAKCFGLVLSLLVSSGLYANNNPEIIAKSNFSIGESIEFRSVVLDESRTLNIYLPTGYDAASDKNYPVIYLLDGSASEDFIHLSGLVQFGSFSWINQLPESIVVGIENVDRKRDFTYPSSNSLDQEEFPTSGGSASFIRFIEEEIQPLVEKNYRTQSPKTIIGQSLGGLLVTEILFKNPNLFDNYIIISPSLWWDDGSLLKFTASKASSPKSIYIGVGKEGEIMEQAANALYTKIDVNKPANYQVYFNYFEQLSHGDTLHLAVYDAFDKIFKNKQNQ
ncbi:alpha/beta hydrolase [Aliiglaciecola sp. SL4]|uniref:alpha/beta hydrolase n=1 Tax=Aliiglaciecola sp. SL4 TaxID=3239806 RepID=UPI00355B853B